MDDPKIWRHPDGLDYSYPPPPADPQRDSSRVHKTEVDVDAVLAERGKRYGEFWRHAEITQQLKGIVEQYGDSTKLTPLHLEALDMIMHKIGRILNGDPNYADSWIDIAGYAKLVTDRLEK